MRHQGSSHRVLGASWSHCSPCTGQQREGAGPGDLGATSAGSESPHLWAMDREGQPHVFCHVWNDLITKSDFSLELEAAHHFPSLPPTHPFNKPLRLVPPAFYISNKLCASKAGHGEGGSQAGPCVHSLSLS